MCVCLCVCMDTVNGRGECSTQLHTSLLFDSMSSSVLIFITASSQCVVEEPVATVKDKKKYCYSKSTLDLI